MLDVEEVRDRVLNLVRPLEPIEVGVADALGYAPAGPISAPHPLPRFDNSAMDGYALRSVDASEASESLPIELEVIGEVAAGASGEVRLRPGTAARIMTGAPLPPGADSVVPVEETEERGGRVVVRTPAPTGRNVRPAGDDFGEGQEVVPGGIELGAGEIALLASLGMTPLKVVRRPRVAVIVTGDELVSVEKEPAPGQIRDSNTVALQTLIETAGGEPVVAPRVPDDLGATVESLANASDQADLIVSSGGVAVGKYDFIKEAVERLGSIESWKVAMQPGKPVVVGLVRDTPFLGLPGNPVSIHVCFEQFVRPAIRKMRGCRSLLRPVIEATLSAPLSKKPGRLHFVRVRLRRTGGSWEAIPTGPQGSHIQSSLVDCHGVARFGRNASHLEAGAKVAVEVWNLPQEEP